MKKIILTLGLFTSIVSYSQMTKYNTLAKEGILEIKQKISDKDTSTYCVLAYQNQEYKTISDIAVIILLDSSEINKFETVLNDFIIVNGTSSSVYDNNSYRLSCSDRYKGIFLYDSRDKWIILNNKQAIKLLESVKKYKNLLN